MKLNAFLLGSIFLCANVGADSFGDSLRTPLDFDSNFPEMIAESSWSEDGGIIYEREFVVRDKGSLVHLVRRYKEIEEDKLQLIWRSDEAKIMDERFCSYSQRVSPRDDDTLVISKKNGYTLICHGDDSGKIMEDDKGGIVPKRVEVGDQYYHFADGNTDVQAGIRAVARATGYYGVRGIGQVTLKFDSGATSCSATSTSNINSPNALIENDIIAALTCRVTKVPGYYPFHIEGCALGPPLCDAQDYITTVYD